MKTRRFWEHKSFSFEEADEFDRRFWRRAGAQARFSAAWLMVVERFKIKGKSSGLPKLQKSVQKVRFIKVK